MINADKTNKIYVSVIFYSKKTMLCPFRVGSFRRMLITYLASKLTSMRQDHIVFILWMSFDIHIAHQIRRMRSVLFSNSPNRLSMKHALAISKSIKLF